MPSDKSGEDKARHAAVQEASLIARTAHLDEVERRLRELSDRLDTREDRMLGRYSDTMRAILTAMSIVAGGAVLAVSILGYFSKSEVSEEVRDMRQAVNYETQKSELRFDKMKADFQQQFTAFAGEALKRPNIEMSIASGPLTNQLLHLKLNGQGQSAIYPLFIKNVGQKPTGPISLYLYSSVGFSQNGNGTWQDESSDQQPEFPFKYRFSFGRFVPLELAPGEPWSYTGDYSDNQFFSWNGSTNVAWCKLVVFYGGESPTEARFRLTFGP